MNKGLILGFGLVGVVGVSVYSRYQKKKAVEKATAMTEEMFDAFQSASAESNEIFDDAAEMFNDVEHLFDECFLRN